MTVVLGASRGTGQDRISFQRAPGFPGRLVLVGLLLWALVPRTASAAIAPDSIRFRWEVGAASDVTNELFMQDSYVDTTFLGRRLTGSPEVRSGMVASAKWQRPIGAGEWTLRLSPDFVVGDKLRRGSFAGELRRSGIEGWNWTFSPELELVDDRSFDLERREVRGSVLARARRALGWSGENSLEFRTGGEVLDVGATSDAFLLAHRNAQAGVSYERTSLTSFDVHVEQRTLVRTFPDSTARNHVEPQLFVSSSRDFAGNQTLGLQLGLNWRTTLAPQESTRDRYRNWTGQLDWTLYAGPEYTFSLGAEEEWMQFATPDSTLDFDYAVHRVQGRARRQWGGAFSAAVGGRSEWLQAPWNPLERYWEAATTLELESLTSGAWYVLSPSVLWREYDQDSQGEGFELQPAHSDFTGLEVFLMLEQAVPGGVRLRGTGVGRVEWHRDSADDARSLYFSLDVRRLF